MGFFEECGVPLKVERGERVFPVSDHSSDIVNALVQKAKDSGCRFLHNCRIKELLLEQTDDGQTVRGALTESGEKIWRTRSSLPPAARATTPPARPGTATSWRARPGTG